MAKYKEIHQSHPDNVECLRYLVHLCTELGRRDDAQEYMAKLRKAERAQVCAQHAGWGRPFFASHLYSAAPDRLILDICTAVDYYQSTSSRV